ncbi:MAG TPA: cupin-like domain-containing protein [Steroidobacteraceae bacterium]
MAEIARKTQVITGVAPDRIPYAELLEAGQPSILKGVARDWSLVRNARESPEKAIAYLKKFCGVTPITVFLGPPEIAGRFFYNEKVTGFNFAAHKVPLAETLDRLQLLMSDEHAPAVYVGSTDIDLYLPGLRAENDLPLNDPMFTHNRPLVSIWLGNRTVASAHFDSTHNLACCVAGHRRFTLFPPDQVHNLYPGPLEPTPGGQVITMVDFNAPDFERFPRFREALAAGQVADLEPGDVLFYPAMWWHHVEALDPFNALINYWWTTTPRYMDSPQTTLMHALLSLRDLRPQEKSAWRELFDYYVFGTAGRAAEHLPESARGNLGPMDDTKARRLRAFLLSRLNR